MNNERAYSIGKHLRARVGLYTTGLKAYWAQFDGLKQRLIDYGTFLEQEMSQFGDVYNFGLVDDEFSGRRAGEYFNEHNVDIVFCHSATYTTSASLLPIHQICKSSLVILNLQPSVAMNYSKTSTGEWLAHCVACAVPELTNAFHRAGIPFRIVNGLLGLKQSPAISATDETTHDHPVAQKAWQEIEEWIRAATVQRTLQHARFGFLGNNYSGMLDLYSDFTLLQGQTGVHVSILEMCDLHTLLQQVTEKEVQQKIGLIHEFFQISGDSPSDPIARKPTEEQMNWSARVAVAQEKLVREYKLDALAYYYHGSNANEYEQIQAGGIVGHSLLTAQGLPCSGEGDIKTALGMKICDILGIGGSFSEIVAADFERNTIILGHDGPFHIRIADSKPVLRGMGVYHGKRGTGVSVEAKVITGDITTLGITQSNDGRLRMIVSQGRSVAEPTLMIGNTQTHVDFGERPDVYMDRWFREFPTHHCAMAVGHRATVFEKLSYLTGIPVSVV